jgi:hypothetical protein
MSAQACDDSGGAPKPGVLNPIVKRSRGDQALRAYILRPSLICRELFGIGLPGTVATTAGVVFSKKLSGHQVRDMVRANNLGV